MENIPDWGWLLLAQFVGTILGWAWGFKRGVIEASEKAIDALIEQGVIRTSKGSNGEIRIHKWNEE